MVVVLHSPSFVLLRRGVVVSLKVKSVSGGAAATASSEFSTLGAASGIVPFYQERERQTRASSFRAVSVSGAKVVCVIVLLHERCPAGGRLTSRPRGYPCYCYCHYFGLISLRGHIYEMIEREW